MPELLRIYDTEGQVLRLEDRTRFYDRLWEQWTPEEIPTEQPHVVWGLLFTSSGALYMQKRSYTKKENAGLFDKPVAGHVNAESEPDATLIREAQEELIQGAVQVVPLEDIVALALRTDLQRTALFAHVQTHNRVPSFRHLSSGRKLISFRVDAYVGYYDGPVRFSDGEACGLELIAYHRLLDEFGDRRTRFTEDFRLLVRLYGGMLGALPPSPKAF